MKEAGNRKPWTGDPILQQYRFCNVYRELDAVTKWIRENWREPNAKNDNLWFAMCIARLFNNSKTLEAIGYPVLKNGYEVLITPYMAHVVRETDKIKARGETVFNPAYIVSTNGVAMDKVLYLMDRVLLPAWSNRQHIAPKEGDTLEVAAKKLIKSPGFAGFMAGQVIADLKYAPVLEKAEDWWTFAVSGPGSRRGLNRVLGFPITARIGESLWHKKLLILQAEINPLMEEQGYEKLHAQDLQNCLCEFDKYERVRLEEGRPKQRYQGV